MELLIWLIGVFVAGAYALYCYGRTKYRYSFEEAWPIIIAGILLWPLALFLSVPGYILYKIGKFFYNLGEKHKEKNGD